MIQAERIGRFEVQERLRANSFAIVYRGRDPFDGRKVEIKFCVATDGSIRRRFLNAAERASSLRHPNVSTVFEFGSGDAKPYLVQETFSEESLSDLLARGEPIDDVLKLYYLVQIASGLQYAHSKEVLHRELRPASVLIDRSGDAKITDFGTARLASAFAQLGNGAHRWPAVGWLLPELLLGLELDERSDIYGFGALAFELLTGQAPYLAQSLAGLVPQILETDPRPLGVHWPECPPELDRLVLRCLARDPGQRFGSMDEVVEELGKIVPVAESADIFEDEKTVVIEDVRTIRVANLGQMVEAPPEETEEKITAEQPMVQTAESKFDWRAAGGRLQGWGRQAGSATKDGMQACLRQLGKIGSAANAKPSFRINSARFRTTGIIVGALLLFGVVGWGVVRIPDREMEPLPTVPPELPVAPVEIADGLLVMDTQPWGEVTRVTGEDGQEIELPASRFTPLAIEVAPGQYTVEISRSDLELRETCVVAVESETIASCEPKLVALEVSALFKETGWWQ